jgi:hypothetical protein
MQLSTPSAPAILRLRSYHYTTPIKLAHTPRSVSRTSKIPRESLFFLFASAGTSRCTIVLHNTIRTFEVDHKLYFCWAPARGVAASEWNEYSIVWLQRTCGVCRSPTEPMMSLFGTFRLFESVRLSIEHWKLIIFRRASKPRDRLSQRQKYITWATQHLTLVCQRMTTTLTMLGTTQMINMHGMNQPHTRAIAECQPR